MWVRSGLRELRLLGPKVREERLALLHPLASTLERLDLPWAGLRSGAHLAALTSLTSLDISSALLAPPQPSTLNPKS